jgi:dTMP kinase
VLNHGLLRSLRRIQEAAVARRAVVSNGRQAEGRPPGSPPGQAVFKSHTPIERRAPLIACEGPDGSGKTTLMQRLSAALGEVGQPALVSNWNDTSEMYNLMMHLNLCGDLTPEMRCIFGGAELAARYHYVILPALRDGTMVLANKYLVSAVAHALVRGHDRQFVSRLYDFALAPDLTLYIDVPPDVALERKRKSGRIGFWEAGLDLALDLSLEESLRLYQSAGLTEEFIARSFVDFQARLRAIHLDLLDGQPVLCLDGSLPEAVVFERLAEALEQVSFGQPAASHLATRIGAGSSPQPTGDSYV